MKHVSVPSWILWTLLVVVLSAAWYGTYRYGFKQGDAQILCAPDVEWNTWYMQCFEAAFKSGVMCPCNRDIEALGICTDILDNRAFTQQEKVSKVREQFGEAWAIAFAPGVQWKGGECKAQGICPKGQCVAWDGACKEYADKYGEDARLCCVSVIPD